MKKGAYLELTLRSPAGSPATNIQTLAQNRLAGTHDGLSIHVLHAATDAANPTAHQVVVYVEGDQPAPDDFQQHATKIIEKQWNSALARTAALTAGAPAATALSLASVDEWDDYDVAANVLPAMVAALATAAPQVAAAAASGCLAPVTGATAVADPAPTGTPVSAPGSADFDSCPSRGDGGDTGTNALKNRDDLPNGQNRQTWITTTVGAILQLPLPNQLPRQRFNWTPAERDAITRVEGLPLQVVGFLAGSRQEHPEACNCHLVNDLDYHVWVVDQQGTDRSQSVVAEVTPRIRSQHPGWTIDNICNLVTNGTRVRISGWLMMDPEHPDQIGKTRGTTWEIHPILAIDVDDGTGTFVPLDQAVGAGGGNGGGGG